MELAAKAALAAPPLATPPAPAVSPAPRHMTPMPAVTKPGLGNLPAGARAPSAQALGRTSATGTPSPVSRTPRSMPKPLRATFAGAVSRSSPNIPAASPAGPSTPAKKTPTPFPAPKAPTPFPAPRAPTPFPAPRAPTPFPAPKTPTPFPAQKKSPVVTTMVSETPSSTVDAQLAPDAIQVEDHTKPQAPLETDLESTLVSEEPSMGVGKSTSLGLGGTMMMDPLPTTPEPAPAVKPALGLGGTLMLDEPGFEESGPTQRDAGPSLDEPSLDGPDTTATSTERSSTDAVAEPAAKTAEPTPLAYEPSAGDQPSAEATPAHADSSPEVSAPVAEASFPDAATKPAAPAAARASTSRSSGLLWLAVTALLVATGIYFYLRSQDAPKTEPLPPEPDSSADSSTDRDSKNSKDPDAEDTAKPTETAEPSASAAADAPSAEPSAEPSAAPSAEPSAAASAEPPPPTAGGDAASLPSDKGYLTVNSGTTAQVTLSGALVGATNQRLEVRCGTAFVRLAKPGKSGTPMNWLTNGRPVVVECQKATAIAIEVGK